MMPREEHDEQELEGEEVPECYGDYDEDEPEVAPENCEVSGQAQKGSAGCGVRGPCRDRQGGAEEREGG